MTPIERVVARDEIRQLAYRYADAIDRHDVNAMVELFVPDARFYPGGNSGPELTRRFWSDTMAQTGVTVLFVGNHLIDVDDHTDARGTVWCRGYIDDRERGFIEQMIKYVDRYRCHEGQWRFVARKHFLWYGMPTTEQPLAQPAANWPRSQIGAGSLPYDDPAWTAFWAEQGGPPVRPPKVRHDPARRGARAGQAGLHARRRRPGGAGPSRPGVGTSRRMGHLARTR